jgi:hypothetical protein
MTHRWGGIVCKVGGRRLVGKAVGLSSSQGNIRCVLIFLFLFVLRQKERKKKEKTGCFHSPFYPVFLPLNKLTGT